MATALPVRIRRLVSEHAHRDPERVARKFARLREDPFAFLRGTNVLFQEDWALGAGVLTKGPLAWQCGDLHAENLGSFRGANRLVYFDLTDFDDAVLAPVLLDITRLVTSVLVALQSARLDGDTREDDVPDADARMLVREMLGAYRRALRTGKAAWIERGTATGLVGDLLHGLKARSRRAFLADRVRLGKRRLRTDGRHALPAPAGEHDAVADAVRTALADVAPDLVVHDVARRLAGNSSLGLPRWVLLVEHALPDARYALLDAKCPAPSAAMLHAPVQPAWADDATRVVTVQRLMQAVPPALLRVAPFGTGALVVRELQPSEDRVQLKDAARKPRALQRLLEQNAQLVAWAQLRASGWHGASPGDALQAFAARDDWEDEVLAYAVRAATTARNDWRAFAEAYDGGRLTP